MPDDNSNLLLFLDNVESFMLLQSDGYDVASSSWLQISLLLHDPVSSCCIEEVVEDDGKLDVVVRRNLYRGLGDATSVISFAIPVSLEAEALMTKMFC